MNRVKYHYNHWLPKLLKADGVTIGRNVFFLGSNPHPTLVRHETIHVQQYQEHGIIKFLLIYLKDYLKGRLKGLNHWDAYMEVPFEIEAYKKQGGK